MYKGISRRDLNFLISSLLIVVAAFVATTGLVSDLWDLNDFVPHKYAGYILAITGFIHVMLHWNRLVGYFRWLLRSNSRQRRFTNRISVKGLGQGSNNNRVTSGSEVKDGDPPIREKRQRKRFKVSRRDFIPLTIGGLGGLALARIIRKDPTLPFKGDVGEIYHEWSKPKLLSLLGTLANWGDKPPLYKE